MKKRTYIQPRVWVEECQLEGMLCVSGGVTSTDMSIEYGGIDDDGTMVPGSRSTY